MRLTPQIELPAIQIRFCKFCHSGVAACFQVWVLSFVSGGREGAQGSQEGYHQHAAGPVWPLLLPCPVRRPDCHPLQAAHYCGTVPVAGCGVCQPLWAVLLVSPAQLLYLDCSDTTGSFPESIPSRCTPLTPAHVLLRRPHCLPQSVVLCTMQAELCHAEQKHRLRSQGSQGSLRQPPSCCAAVQQLLLRGTAHDLELLTSRQPALHTKLWRMKQTQCLRTESALWW